MLNQQRGYIMSVTVVNLAIKQHESSKQQAMSAYPYGHPARYAVWQEYNVPVAGGDSFHMSEWAIKPIWDALLNNGWDKSVSMFPCQGMKRLALISALQRLMDAHVAESAPCPVLLSALNSLSEDGETVIGFNTQTTLAALEGLIAFLERNEDIYSL